MGFKESILGAGSQVVIGEVRADASRAEIHKIEGDVTSHRVEEGIDVADNYRVKPRTISIDGTITNTPLAVGFPLETAIDGVKNLAAGNKQPVDEAWKELQRYLDEAELITITTSLQEYQNMAITSLSVTRNKDAGQSLQFSISAKEIQFVSTSLVKAIPVPKEPRGEGEKDLGKDTNSNASESQDAKARSWARKEQWKNFKGGVPSQ